MEDAFTDLQQSILYLGVVDVQADLNVCIDLALERTNPFAANGILFEFALHRWECGIGRESMVDVLEVLWNHFINRFAKPESDEAEGTDGGDSMGGNSTTGKLSFRQMKENFARVMRNDSVLVSSLPPEVMKVVNRFAEYLDSATQACGAQSSYITPPSPQRGQSSGTGSVQSFEFDSPPRDDNFQLLPGEPRPRCVLSH